MDLMSQSCNKAIIVFPCVLTIRVSFCWLAVKANYSRSICFFSS